MSSKQISLQRDRDAMAQWLADAPDTERVADFVPGPGIQRLELKFDIVELRRALSELTDATEYRSAYSDKGFGAISLTRRPGVEVETENDLSGRYWLRPVFGLAWGATYHAIGVSMTGLAAREGLAGDPDLVDASVSTQMLRLWAGLVLSI